MRTAFLITVYLLTPSDRLSGPEWVQCCTVTPDTLRCVLYSAPPPLDDCSSLYAGVSP